MITKNIKTSLCSNCGSSDLEYKFSQNHFQIFFCPHCQIGLTYPQPKNMDKFYHAKYWTSPGLTGFLKNKFFKFFQRRRTKWVASFLNQKDTLILDVGSGEGAFAKAVRNKYQVINLDTPNSKIKNQAVTKADYLAWKSPKKFDAIVFWQSLEHTDLPEKYLHKAKTILKPGGFVFIEYPRFDSWEAKLFKQHWFHLDPPRHLVHLTEKGIINFLTKNGFKLIKNQPISAFEYTIWGGLASLLNFFGIKYTDLIKKGRGNFYLILIIPFLIISFWLQLFFLICNQSPIGLIIAQNKSKR